MSSRIRRFALRFAFLAALPISFAALPCPARAVDAPPGTNQQFGDALTLSEPTPLASVLAAPERYADEPLLLRGRLVDVCQKKGCWTVLQDGNAAVRVRFQDYGFFLPQGALGRDALVEGVASVRELSEREARHYEAESRDGNPASVRGPQQEIGFVASGVRLIAPD